MLGILKVIDSVCQKHELRYYITAGTMLGAIRHKGFIPWDDDADICMPRPDYEKLIAHCQEWLPEHYEMVCAENDSNYPHPFGKIQDSRTTLIERAHLGHVGGVYVDVFPVDGMPESRWRRRLHFMHYKYLCKLLYFTCRDPYRHGHGPNSWIPLLCRKFYKLADVQSRIRRLLLKYNYEGSRYVADYDDGLRGVMPKTVLGLPTPYEFEGEQVRGVEQYDTYLSQKYGDYMTPPPAGTEFQHNIHYMNLEMPYKEYNT
jgi:lipopolysaccharide cholinephosphotransferase